jgi:predicted DCC family thiol-disulfide oxidoreductase YuxK
MNSVVIYSTLKTAPETAHAIILFDGVCNFCNGAVQFIIKRDPEGYFRFASQQSEIGQKLIHQYDLDRENNDSIFLIEDGRAYTHSTAAIRIARNLKGFWKAFYYFVYIPKFLRDFGYDLIAKYRYRIFGKRETCMIPRPEWKERFLD